VSRQVVSELLVGGGDEVSGSPELGSEVAVGLGESVKAGHHEIAASLRVPRGAGEAVGNPRELRPDSQTETDRGRTTEEI